MISVIIPAHNEERVIARTLEAMVAGASPGELEIIVVANGCSDATADVARGFGERLEHARGLRGQARFDAAAANAARARVEDPVSNPQHDGEAPRFRLSCHRKPLISSREPAALGLIAGNRRSTRRGPGACLR